MESTTYAVLIQIFRIFPPFSTQISKQIGKQSASAIIKIFHPRAVRARHECQRDHVSRPLPLEILFGQLLEQQGVIVRYENSSDIENGQRWPGPVPEQQVLGTSEIGETRKPNGTFN